MDYALPRSDDIPAMVIDHLGTPSSLNPLGLKGSGVVASAVEDALGVRVEEVPIAPRVLSRL